MLYKVNVFKKNKQKTKQITLFLSVHASQKKEIK